MVEELLKKTEESPLMEQVLYEIKKVIVGQDHLLERVLVAILSQGHLLVEGVPGLAKTLTIKTLAEAVNCSFKRIQFTPDLVPADLVGTRIYNQRSGEFSTSLGPVFTNLLLADEINRAPAKVQSALLEVMQEHQVTIAGQTYKVPEPFLVMATQNPIETEGTYPLPEAQLDRFFFKVNVDLPNIGEMVEILDRTTGKESPAANKAVSGAEIVEMRALARTVPIASHVKEYIAKLMLATHPDDPNASPLVKKYVRYGVSPRGGQALVLGAKVTALMAGRYNVSFEDVHAVARAALRHRLLLNFDGLAEGIQPDAVIDELTNSMEKAK